MSDLKTKQTDKSVNEFLSKIEDPIKQKASRQILKIMKEVSKTDPKMWGESIIGFGNYHYKYATGREGDWMRIGFSPRKQYLTLYIMDGFDKYNELMEKLGKYKTGKSCLYIKKMQDIDINILKELMKESLLNMDKLFPGQ
ncbi:DUF1801 domain-containing protein [Promethearchaeum syntrophicum]|uniref:DUF1801 domain-containing protein n=1 Tax=Promethearchaeum syntrophicum TaxID=2594042 RepID=A0A5B9DHB8_9ARCH|nr:DUF1801 domain-containing protein [Candidatus Prometheoarchaeum syntrophicum]